MENSQVFFLTPKGFLPLRYEMGDLKEMKDEETRLLPFTSQWTAQDQEESCIAAQCYQTFGALQRLQFCLPGTGGGESLTKK